MKINRFGILKLWNFETLEPWNFVFFFIFKQGNPPTPQHTDSHPSTRPPSWGTRGNLGDTRPARDRTYLNRIPHLLRFEGKGGRQQLPGYLPRREQDRCFVNADVKSQYFCCVAFGSLLDQSGRLLMRYLAACFCVKPSTKYSRRRETVLGLNMQIILPDSIPHKVYVSECLFRVLECVKVLRCWSWLIPKAGHTNKIVFLTAFAVPMIPTP